MYRFSGTKSSEKDYFTSEIQAVAVHSGVKYYCFEKEGRGLLDGGVGNGGSYFD